MFLTAAGCDPPDCNHWSNKTGFGLICQPGAPDIICSATPSAQALPVALGRIHYCSLIYAGLASMKWLQNICKVWVLVFQRWLLAGSLRLGARSRTGIGNMPGWGDAAIGTPVPWLRPNSGSVPPVSSGVSFRRSERATLATQEQKRDKLPHPDLCNWLCKSTGMD